MNEVMKNSREYNPTNTVAIFWGGVLDSGRVVSMEGLRGLMESGRDVKLVDVREREMYDKRHICGAISIPVSELEITAPELLDPDDLIVVVSQKERCAASAVAADKLRTLHYTNVLRYAGGYREWRLKGGCTEEGREEVFEEAA